MLIPLFETNIYLLFNFSIIFQSMYDSFQMTATVDLWTSNSHQIPSITATEAALHVLNQEFGSAGLWECLYETGVRLLHHILERSTDQMKRICLCVM